MNRLLRILIRNIDNILFYVLILGSCISFVSIFVDEFRGLTESKESVLLALAMLGSVMALIMVRFLSGSSLSSARDEMYKYELNPLLSKLRAQAAKQASPVSAEDEQRITDVIIERIKSEANATYIESLKSEIKESEYKLDLFKRGKSTLNRIYREIDALGRRGTVNLVLGVITALSGVIALSFFVLAKGGAHSSISEFAMDFLPRLSIVLIIEVFSYFFLRLYKTSLSEIKYFQNEATNIEHSFVALEVAISIDDRSLIEKCIRTFLGVERNPIMSNEQTTREIIQEVQASKDTQLSPETLAKIIGALRKNGNV